MNGYEGFTQVAKKVSRQAGSDTVSPKNPNRKTSIKKNFLKQNYLWEFMSDWLKLPVEKGGRGALITIIRPDVSSSDNLRKSYYKSSVPVSMVP